MPTTPPPPDRAAPGAVAGVDVGGTFTDCVRVEPDGTVTARKVPTTPEDQSLAVAAGLAAVAEGAHEATTHVAHGTTTATNAVLERRVARTALVVTAEVADVLRLARQDRPSLYDLSVVRPAPLVDDDRVVAVEERLGASGEVLVPLTDAEVDRVAEAVASLAPEAVAISLLFGYADPTHERRLAAALRERLGPDVPITAASALLPELREHERTSTCVLNAAVAPVMQRYLSRLAGRVAPASVSVMTSGGGVDALDAVADAPVRTLLSGPAAGVVAAGRIAEAAGWPDALALDMGGTSTDVCLIQEGRPQRRGDGEIAGLPFRTPSVAIHTVGAGGGSLAWVDAGGALRVGPRSAGAQPGPACYGRGGREPTVTDAHAAAGHLGQAPALGSGALRLDPDAAERALARLPEAVARHAGTAASVLTVVRATMARALRHVSTEQGVDPTDLALVAYGGAGPLHACALARELGCPAVIVPPAPGVASALGLLLAPPRAETSRTVMARVAPDDAETSGLAEAWEGLAADARAAVARQDAGSVTVRWLADLRYAGQAHELRCAVDDADPATIREALHRAHLGRYGHAPRDAVVEVVTLRAVATGEPALASPPQRFGLGAQAPEASHQPITLADGRVVPATVWARRALAPGVELAGPALVTQPDATTLLEPGDVGRVDARGNLVIGVGSADEASGGR